MSKKFFIMFIAAIACVCLFCSCSAQTGTHQGSGQNAAAPERNTDNSDVSPDAPTISDLSASPEGDVLSPEQLDAKYDSYGLNFSDDDLQAAVLAAEQYYEWLCSQEIDESAFSDKELENLRRRNEWLEQGIQLTYDRETAYREIDGTTLKDNVKNNPGTVIVLNADAAAAPDGDDWHYRKVYLMRESTDSDWEVIADGY